jgi:hypothetical protein
MKVAKFLLSVKDECNQHLQTELKGISIKKGIKICKQLEKITGNSYVLEVWTCDSYSIYEKDTWKAGEHPLGHRDRLICSVDNK